MPKITIIVAIAENYAIGCHNKLPWHLPADLKHFKELTTGHTIVMGRLTFESLPNGALPNRENIVLSRTYTSDKISKKRNAKAKICNSIDNLLEELSTRSPLFDEQIFIIGGSSVYEQFMDKADAMYITWIHAEVEADTFFPKIDFSKWKEISRANHKADEKNQYDYSFVEYQRRV